jgi:hypothetical protein
VGRRRTERTWFSRERASGQGSAEGAGVIQGSAFRTTPVLASMYVSGPGAAAAAELVGGETDTAAGATLGKIKRRNDEKSPPRDSLGN